MNAVLYCRVSTVEQAQNLSLATQEEACRDYCRRQGYTVDQVFIDAGESAKTTDRPEFRRMLEHCRRGRGRLHAVIVYSLTRFSRNSADHHAIAGVLRGLGIALRSVTEPIDESPSGKLMEGILAAMAQFDNDVRSERVTAGLKAAAGRGRWAWRAPLGYRNGTSRSGPSLVPDPARAPAVREAFELCARGIVGAALLQRMRELGLTTPKGHPISRARLYQLLRAPVYAGIVRIAKWGHEHRGDFEALVSPDVFGRVQAQLTKPLPPAADATAVRTERADLFPLRRFVTCASCGRAISGSLSRGRTGVQYPFYHCARGCQRVPKAVLEQRFIELLDQLKPHPALWKVLEARVLRAWRTATADAGAAAAAARMRLNALEGKRRRLDALFIDQQAIDADTYRTRRDELREQIAFETLTANAEHEAALDVDSMLSFAEHAMTHAGALWSTETSTARRTTLQWALFPTGVRLENGAFETPLTCLEFFGLTPRAPHEKGLVDHPAPNWKQSAAWLTSLYQLKPAA